MPFAITNRKADSGFAFGNVPGNSIYYGTLAPKGKGAEFSPIGEGSGAQAEIGLFKALKSRLEQTKRNVVFLVNGDGQDIGHVARIGAALETDYAVEVVLLAWPAAESNLGKYKAHYGYARESAPMFFEVLSRWLDIAGTAVSPQASRQVLFCHSLGNQLLEVSSQHPKFPQIMATFRTVVINAADVDASTHMLWVSRIGQRACVVQNGNDGVLKTAEGGLGSLLLGENPMKGKMRLGRAVDLPVRVTQATYVDVTQAGDAGKQHEYYAELKSGSSLKALYSKLLADRADVPDLSGIAAREGGGNLWRLK